MAGTYRKKTLRKMSPVTRELARLTGEVASVQRRLKGLVAKIQVMEQKEIERQAEAQKVLTTLKGGG
jgi:hypothetical protein